MRTVISKLSIVNVFGSYACFLTACSVTIPDTQQTQRVDQRGGMQASGDATSTEGGATSNTKAEGSASTSADASSEFPNGNTSSSDGTVTDKTTTESSDAKVKIPPKTAKPTQITLKPNIKWATGMGYLSGIYPSADRQQAYCFGLSQASTVTNNQQLIATHFDPDQMACTSDIFRFSIDDGTYVQFIWNDKNSTMALMQSQGYGATRTVVGLKLLDVQAKTTTSKAPAQPIALGASLPGLRGGGSWLGSLVVSQSNSNIMISYNTETDTWKTLQADDIYKNRVFAAGNYLIAIISSFGGASSPPQYLRMGTKFTGFSAYSAPNYLGAFVMQLSDNLGDKTVYATYQNGTGIGTAIYDATSDSWTRGSTNLNTLLLASNVVNAITASINYATSHYYGLMLVAKQTNTSAIPTEKFVLVSDNETQALTTIPIPAGWDQQKGKPSFWLKDRGYITVGAYGNPDQIMVVAP